VQDRRAARRYAKALFEAARAGGTVKPVETDLALIVGLLKSYDEFRHFMVAPYTSREEKIAILDRVFGPVTSPVTMQLLKIMIEKRREAEVTVVYEEYVEMRRALEQVAYAVVTSADALDATQQKDLVAKLEKVLGKKIEPEFKVDPALIGGVRVKYENFVLDGSVRGALGRLKEKLRHDVLKQQA